MIRAVVDANVWVSAFLKPESTPGRVLDAWRRHEFEAHLASVTVVEVAREVTAEEPREPKAAGLEQAQQAELRKSVEDLSVDKVVQKLSAVGLETSRALQRISEQLVEEVQELERVREAARLERAEVERLHKIDVAATALDLLVAEHAAKQQ